MAFIHTGFTGVSFIVKKSRRQHVDERNISRSISFFSRLHGFLMLPLFLNQQLKLSDSDWTAIKKETSCDIVPRPASQPLCGANSSIFWAFKNRPGWPPDSDPAPSTLEEKLALGLKKG